MAHDLHDYLFDLKGYLVLKGAVDAQHVAELNEALDSAPRDLARREWWGNCQLSSDSAEVVSFETSRRGGRAVRAADRSSVLDRARAALLRRAGQLRLRGSVPRHGHGHAAADRRLRGNAPGRRRARAANAVPLLRSAVVLRPGQHPARP